VLSRSDEFAAFLVDEEPTLGAGLAAGGVPTDVELLTLGMKELVRLRQVQGDISAFLYSSDTYSSIPQG
jgi:hypothetical protein